MIDHVYISVTDLDKASKLYEALLEPLGWTVIGKYEAPLGSGAPDLYGFADKDYGGSDRRGCSIWLRQAEAGKGIYVGLVSETTEDVDTAYNAAMKADGNDGGAPGLREYFGPGYYAANIIDFDGNTLEIVNKS